MTFDLLLFAMLLASMSTGFCFISQIAVGFIVFRSKQVNKEK